MTPRNIQPIEKIAFSKTATSFKNNSLDVHSVFHTIQGEGPFAGTPAVFIRLAGCNLQCPGCDTDYTSARKIWDVLELVDYVGDYRCPFIVLTGGEPFRQNIHALVKLLVRKGFYVQIETNGTLPAQGTDYQKDISKRSGAYIVCSPKTGKIHATIMAQACALKYVLRADSVSGLDGLPIEALGHTVAPVVARNVLNYDLLTYLQPMDCKDPVQNDLNLKAVIKSCMRYNYICQVQIHKIINME